MSKLYEARKCTLTKPLSKEEIGYVYNSKDFSCPACLPPGKRDKHGTGEKRM